jgi:hypothetical protein
VIHDLPQHLPRRVKILAVEIILVGEVRSRHPNDDGRTELHDADSARQRLRVSKSLWRRSGLPAGVKNALGVYRQREIPARTRASGRLLFGAPNDDFGLRVGAGDELGRLHAHNLALILVRAMRRHLQQSGGFSE